MKNIEKKVIEIAAGVMGLRPDQITAHSSFNELGADSLHLIEIVVALENQFGVTIPDDELLTIATVQDAVERIHTDI